MRSWRSSGAANRSAFSWPASRRTWCRRRCCRGPGDRDRGPDRLATEEGKPTTEHRVILPSLQPATQYRYRIEGATETPLFTSAPEVGTEGPFTVLVYGDNRSNNGDHALVARAAAGERAQLALHTGDMVVNANEPESMVPETGPTSTC